MTYREHEPLALDQTKVAFTLRDLVLVLASVVSTTIASTVAWVNLNSTDTLLALKLEQQQKELAGVHQDMRELREKLIAIRNK